MQVEEEAPAVPFVPRQPEVNDPSDPCFAGSYLGLLGRDIDSVILSPAGGLRIHRPQLFETAEPEGEGETEGEESMPQRLNVDVDANGMVQRVYCG